MSRIIKSITLLSAAAVIMLAGITTQGISASAEEEPVAGKKIAIVIDDLGNDMQGTKEMMEMPVPITVAVMPFLPTTKRDAEWAHRMGYDVLIHMPMEPVRGKKSWLGPGAITTDLSDEEIRKRVLAAIEEVPFAIGMNNHMGSKATSDPRVMRVVLQACKEKNLLYLDSKTSHKSVVKKMAEEMGVRTLENNLFMDDIYTREHIVKQGLKLQKYVDGHEATVVIGHVGPPGKHTAAVLKETIPTLQKKGQVVTISKLAP